VILASRINLVSHSAGVIKTHSRESALDERLNPGVLILKINRMNNDDEANDANDNGEDFNVGRPEMERRLPETERQELERLRRERAQQILELRQEREQLLLEIQRLRRLEAQRQRALEVQAETRRIWAEDADFREARAVRVARRQIPTQRQAFEAHVLERQQQQQQAESVEEDAEEDTDTVSSSMVEPNP